jgi:hypothetical protein
MAAACSRASRRIWKRLREFDCGKAGGLSELACEKAPRCRAFCYLPVGAGVRVEPLGEGLIWVLPDGFSPLARPAAALPASFDMPLLGAVVELPVVVPLGEDPAVVPVAAPPPAADPPPPDCARAKPPVTVSAAAMANVASFMIAPFVVRP